MTGTTRVARKVAMVGAAMIIVFVLIAIFAPLLCSIFGVDPETSHADQLDDLAKRRSDGVPYLVGVVLDPASVGEVLGELAVRRDDAAAARGDGAAAHPRRAGIDRDDHRRVGSRRGTGATGSHFVTSQGSGASRFIGRARRHSDRWG